MKELVENIEKQITTDKEVISVLPRNGIKAIKTLLKTIDETTEKYENLNEKLLKEIESRYEKLTEVEDNTEIPCSPHLFPWVSRIWYISGLRSRNTPHSLRRRAVWSRSKA